jgi:hypothetical protein
MSLNLPSLDKALELIRATPGYENIAAELARLAAQGRIRVDSKLEDRAQAGLLGTITLGPEAIESNPLSLAQTLVHEHYHLHQNPLEKTVSFWSGVWQRTPVMRRYEQPAYRAALRFLNAVENSQPHRAEEVQREQAAIRQVFAINFGGEIE